MDRQALEQLVAKGEGAGLEFKRKVRHPDKIAREFVAFANSHGGIILIGVDDDGTIYGNKDADGEGYLLEKWLAQHITPSLPYQRKDVHVTANRKVLVYQVFAGSDKPYRLAVEGEDGEWRRFAYVRQSDMSIKASRELTQVLRMSQREKGVSISFGDREKELLAHLEQHVDITLDSAQKLLQLNKRKTSGLLILLTRAGLLRLHPSEKGDRYSLMKEAFE
ncbi:MAG: ATP-binding protein [Bacteroidia bacterium]|nr:ATP-binding protein [Bacteroidia bacterium]